VSGTLDNAAPKPRGEVVLALEGITKAYPAVIANEAVSLAVRRGHIHAILGENGAGKSTLMKIISGVTAPDAGTIRWKGEAVAIRSPAHARALGIGMVFQHFALFETMTVAENIALAMSRSARALAPRISELGARLSLEVEPDSPVHTLSVGERQRVEIIRCLLQDPDLIILDEPTAVLPPSRVPAFFATLRRLADEGRAILFISHKLEEIRSLCHTATVMRHGKVVATVDPTATSADELARLMIGRAIPHPERTGRAELAAPALVVDALSLAPADPFAVPLDQVSLEVRRGEIVGIAGISGNGQSELMRALSGETRLTAEAQARIRLNGKDIGALGSRERRRIGLGFVPEDRQGRGTIGTLPLSANALLTASDKGFVRSGMIRFDKVRAFARSVIDGYDVRCAGPQAVARSLSGGNLQKFIMGREIELAPQVLLISQPTWGVDVGAAAAIRQKLLDMAGRGMAILVVSDELEELFEIADRLHVMFRGALSPAVAARGASRDAIGLAITGSFDALDTMETERRRAHA
jgi:ABC-type uncharacterized transport system ATPase subunit